MLKTAPKFERISLTELKEKLPPEERRILDEENTATKHRRLNQTGRHGLGNSRSHKNPRGNTGSV